MMRLYHYDHCPYCVKARMIFGLKNIPLELVALANHDDATPVSMVGKKLVPILKNHEDRYMGESLDIIAYADELKDFGPPILERCPKDAELNLWLTEARQYHYHLAMPRWPQVGLPEFESSKSVDYFINKKSLSIGDFDEAIRATPELVQMALSHLQVLEQGMPSAGYWHGYVSVDDFHLFSTLRVLTVVKGIKFPERVENYMNTLSEKCKVPLHWSRAL